MVNEKNCADENDLNVIEMPFKDLETLDKFLMEIGATSQETCSEIYDLVYKTNAIYVETVKHTAYIFKIKS